MSQNEHVDNQVNYRIGKSHAENNPEARYHDLVVKYVRETQNLKGKWMNIRVLAETGKPDLFRDEKGHFVKVEV